MDRYKVIVKDVVWRRTLYPVGSVMPMEFTTRDRIRHVYSRRFQLISAEEAAALELMAQVAAEAAPATTPPPVQAPTTPTAEPKK